MTDNPMIMIGHVSLQKVKVLDREDQYMLSVGTSSIIVTEDELMKAGRIVEIAIMERVFK